MYFKNKSRTWTCKYLKQRANISDQAQIFVSASWLSSNMRKLAGEMALDENNVGNWQIFFLPCMLESRKFFLSPGRWKTVTFMGKRRTFLVYWGPKAIWTKDLRGNRIYLKALPVHLLTDEWPDSLRFFVLLFFNWDFKLGFQLKYK